MTAESDDDILDSLFHGSALVAYLDQAAASGQWPPDCEATKHRANRYYEEALAAKTAAKEPAGWPDNQPAALTDRTSQGKTRG